MPKKLVYPLEHAYTQAELDFSMLKGRDAAVAGVLASAAKLTDYDLRLALLTIEESGGAEYAESFGSRRGRWYENEEFEAGEIFERSVRLSDWRTSEDQATIFDTIPVEENEISPPDACDSLTPDEENFYEATGNEGASFERSYRRAALVLWQKERSFAVLSQAGLSATLPYLDHLVSCWEEMGKASQAPLRREAQELAKYMLAQWPRQSSHYDRTESNAATMLALLARLDDGNRIERFLTNVTATGLYAKEDNPAIINAFHSLSPTQRVILIEDIVAGTALTKFEACADLLARAATAWEARQVDNLSNAARRLIEAIPGDPERIVPPWQGGCTVTPDFIANLLTALNAIDATLVERAVEHFFRWPKTYGLDAILVPALRKLSSVDVAQTSVGLDRLRSVCSEHLQARVCEPLEPPTDQRRPCALPCKCAACTELARFLDDPQRAVWSYKALQANRKHVEETIQRAKPDLDTQTERRGSPHSLVCTKNRPSYERRVRQRIQDLDDLQLIEQSKSAASSPTPAR